MDEFLVGKAIVTEQELEELKAKFRSKRKDMFVGQTRDGEVVPKENPSFQDFLDSLFSNGIDQELDDEEEDRNE